jgi:hypothetical protein
MFLDPTAIAESPFYPVTSFPGTPATLHVPSAGDPVVGLRIAPPEMLSSLDAYAPGVDYAACIDFGSGHGEIDLRADGSYVVVIDRSSTAQTILVVDVGIKSLGTCYRRGAIKEFDCPTPPKAFEGDDVDEPPDFENQCSVTSIADLARKVATAAGTGTIDLVLVDHGCEGAITINGREKISCDPADAANLRAFCQLNGRIRSLTLLSCSTGHGAAGTDFLRKLSRKFGGICVTGYTGNVSSWNRRGRRVWGSYGVANKQLVPALHRSPPPFGPMSDLALFFTTSHLPRSAGALVIAAAWTKRS